MDRSEEDAVALAAWLKARRTELRIGKAEAARRAGVGRVSWHEWEAGRRHPYDANYAGIEDAMQVERGYVEELISKRKQQEDPPAENHDREEQSPCRDDLTDEDEVRFRVLKDTIRAEELTDELRWALLRHIFDAMGVEPTPAAVDAWLNNPDRLEAIRATQSRKETDQVTPREHS